MTDSAGRRNLDSNCDKSHSSPYLSLLQSIVFDLLGVHQRNAYSSQWDFMFEFKHCVYCCCDKILFQFKHCELIKFVLCKGLLSSACGAYFNLHRPTRTHIPDVDNFLYVQYFLQINIIKVFNTCSTFFKLFSNVSNTFKNIHVFEF